MAEKKTSNSENLSSYFVQTRKKAVVTHSPPENRETEDTRGSKRTREGSAESDKDLLHQILKSISTLESNFTAKLNDFKEDIRKDIDLLVREKSKLTQEVTKMREELNNYKERVEYLESREKACNIIIKGKEEGPEEDTYRVVREILVNELKVENANIREARRFGRGGSDQPRPILAVFENQKMKLDVLKEKSKLKGSRVFIESDLTRAARERKLRKLRMVRKLRENRQNKVFLRGERIFLNGKYYKLIEGEEEDDDELELLSPSKPKN